jgi:hypothetical protein
MRIERTVDFDDERARFALRFCCEDCGHFDASTERCRHDWPTAPHRRSAVEPAAIDFCKEFELC